MATNSVPPPPPDVQLAALAAATLAAASAFGILLRSKALSNSTIQELTQSAIAILFIVGYGYLLVVQPNADHTGVTSILGMIVGFYFGAKSVQGATSGGNGSK